MNVAPRKPLDKVPLWIMAAIVLAVIAFAMYGARA